MKKRVMPVFCLLMAATGVFFSLSCGQPRPPADYNNILVTRVFDGDTIEVQTGEKVRLIGIDCPEAHESDKLFRQAERRHKDIRVILAMGRRAREFTSGLVYYKHVRLVFDEEHYDKYGRLLAYVYLEDGTFVNAEIIKSGYAYLLSIPPNDRFADTFRDLYRQARREQRGLWKGE
ncbi:MAG: thermonuclease family protein [Candidatus Omnitrophica bacterium]|nr:thermonuclease family protein [Candidatus Omnitrophota bacterium]